MIACVGRVELGEQHIGTAFLVTPTLAITNRHVAQAIARFKDDRILLKAAVHVDFGREEWNGKASFDRRDAQEIMFAGKDPIVDPIDHHKLDLAVLRLSRSTLAGDQADRHIALVEVDADEFDSARIVATAGYPANPEDYVPSGLQSKYADVIKRLLEGDGGAKRFAPGMPAEFTGAGPADWTATHDATTINGNSGSPLFVLETTQGPPSVQAGGLHYGGNWGGERSNWAHLLALTKGAVGYGGSKTFAEFCQGEGIAL